MTDLVACPACHTPIYSGYGSLCWACRIAASRRRDVVSTQRNLALTCLGTAVFLALVHGAASWLGLGFGLVEAGASTFLVGSAP